MAAYVGEIRMFAGNFAPNGWMFCNGQELPISENDTLFTLIGTIYGGDGQSTFKLPNLQSRVPIHMGSYNSITYQIGEAAGVETVTLTTNQMPSHNHAFIASLNPSDTPNPQNNILGVSTNVRAFYSDTPNTSLNAGSVNFIGGSQPHENMQPFLCINFIISLYGVFPSQT